MKFFILPIILIISIVAVFNSYKIFNKNQDSLDLAFSENKTHKLETNIQVKSEINESDFDVNFLAKDLDNNFDNLDYKVTTGKNEKIIYGDCLKVSGTLSRPENTSSSKSETLYNFPYKEYLAKDNVYLLYKVKYFEKMENCPVLNIYQKVKLSFLLKKQEITKIFLDKYEQPYAGLVAGVLIAGKGLMDRETLEMFKKVSLSHVIVLSGSNVSIIIFCIKYFFDFIFALFRVRENLYVEFFKKVLILISVTSFVLLTGGGPPIYRAFISAFFALIIFKKNTSQIYALTIVVLVMTIINPFGSIYDPSFHLTCCATYGLILFSKYFDKLMIFSRLNFLPNFLREIVSVTLATQVFVFPYIIFMSSSFSTVFLFSNIIILPLIPFIMLLGFLSLFPFVGGVCIFFNNILLHVVFILVKFLSETPYAYIIFSKNVSVGILMIYGVFVLFLFWKMREG